MNGVRELQERVRGAQGFTRSSTSAKSAPATLLGHPAIDAASFHHRAQGSTEDDSSSRENGCQEVNRTWLITPPGFDRGGAAPVRWGDVTSYARWNEITHGVEGIAEILTRRRWPSWTNERTFEARGKVLARRSRQRNSTRSHAGFSAGEGDTVPAIDHLAGGRRTPAGAWNHGPVEAR